MPLEIRDRFSNRIIYSSYKATTIREALQEALAAGANLSGADLRSADLSGADLSGAYLRSADLRSANLRSAYLSGANLRSAYLSGANLSGAYLSGANLSGANLSGADLSGAYLSGANLSGADLSGANLSGADLSGAKGLDKHFVQPLHFLMHQPGKIRMYKMVANDYGSPMRYTADERIFYEVGKKYSVEAASTDEQEDCGAGLHVSTLPWIACNWQRDRRLLLVEFTANDIACIPLDASGKFRVHRFKVVEELDPKEFGLPMEEEANAKT